LAHVEDLPHVIGMLGVTLAVGCVGAVAAVVVRLRRSSGVERQQMKWFLFATAPIFTFPITDLLPSIVDGLVLMRVLISLPAAIGVAGLRFRLYDIDVVINRTLVYGILTATLVAVYLESVVGLQRLLPPMTGEGNQLSIAVLYTSMTLVLCGVFLPDWVGAFTVHPSLWLPVDLPNSLVAGCFEASQDDLSTTLYPRFGESLFYEVG